MKISKIMPDDPRLTAYALGELEPDEMAIVAAAIKDDPQAQAAVAQIRALSGDLTAALAKEPLPFVVPPKDIVAKQPPAVEAYAPRRFVRFPYYILGGLAAACVVAMFVVQEREVAKRDKAIAAVRAERLSRRKAAEEKAKQEAAANGVYEIDLKDDDEGGHVVNIPQPTLGVATTEGIVQAGPLQKPSESTNIARLDAKDKAAKEVEAKAQANREVAVAANPEPQTVGATSKPNQSGQTTLAQVDANRPESSSEIVTLSPFAVASEKQAGHAVTDSLARARSVAAPKAIGAVPLRAPTVGGPSFAKTDSNTEGYGYQTENDYAAVADAPLSTFSVDVDTASYANTRRFLNQGQRPPVDAVRIEELVNYFPYHYNAPKDDRPFEASMEVASAPWNPQHRLVRIGLKGREIPESERPAMNLVFLLDVSGSMDEPNKLPLVKESMRLLIERLKPTDRVAIVVYAGASGLALPSTPASEKKEILGALDSLQPGGSTNGAMGIQLAYDIAKANFIKDGANRVVLCTDGDFNVGVTSQGDLTRLIEKKAKSGVFLSVLGFGMGNLKDDTLQKLADKGNGNYGYIDNFSEARKLLVDQLSGTLVTIAKDVKVQVEFNPARVKSYRLIGYEKRMLPAQDFNNDKIDAGEIGAGHTVTALYEVVPAGVESAGDVPSIDALKYHPTKGTEFARAGEAASAELLTVKIRYKEPAGDESRKLEFPLMDGGRMFSDASQDFKFAAAVAGFGMMLRESPHKGSTTYESVMGWAESGLGEDIGGHRHEFLDLVKKARDING